MRDKFAEWYWPDDDELKEFTTSARIVLDANILLDFYRRSKETRDRLFEALEREEVRPRLFMPYQVGLEYHRNRLVEAGSHGAQYDNVIAALDRIMSDSKSGVAEVRRTIAQIRDPEVGDRLNSVLDELIGKAIKKVRRSVKREREANLLPSENMRTNDPIRDRIEEIYRDHAQIGDRLSGSEYEARTKSARDRLNNSRPPGTADRDKSDGGVGDVLIWMELLELARSAESDVLFVSNDSKDDWVLRDTRNRKIGPRPELRNEFLGETGKRFHHVTLDTFLHYLDSYLNVDVGLDVIDEVARESRSQVVEEPLRTAGFGQLYRDVYPSIPISEVLRKYGGMVSLGDPNLKSSLASLVPPGVLGTEIAGGGFLSEYLRDLGVMDGLWQGDPDFSRKILDQAFPSRGLGRGVLGGPPYDNDLDLNEDDDSEQDCDDGDE